MRRLLLPAAAAAVTLAFAGGTAQAAYQPPIIANDTLVAIGDDASDVLEIRRQVGDATKIEVDVGDDGNVEGTFNLGAFTKIAVAAGGGNDIVRIDEAGNNDAIATATIDGEGGDDDLNGGSSADVIFGGIGDDKIDGDRGNDNQQGQNGADTITWDPGDGNDVVDGGAGVDLHRFNGASVAGPETITINRSQTDDDRVELKRNLANIDMDIVATEGIEVIGKGGIDQISAGPGLPGVKKLRLFGGDPANPLVESGTDLLQGGDSDDVLDGGDDADVLNAGLGNDTVIGGPGADLLSCGGQEDDIVFSDAADTVNADCFVDAPAPKADPPKVDPPVVEQPKADQPKAAAPPAVAPIVRSAAIPQPVALVGRGFATPKVSGSFRALRVSVRSTASVPIDVAITASDAGYTYRAKRRTITPGMTYTVVLNAPKALRTLVARKARRSRIVRRPAVRVVNLKTNASQLVTPRIAVKKGAR
jgi:RTX calcium-binding nonapeptide repeat (4 copies)